MDTIKGVPVSDSDRRHFEFIEKLEEDLVRDLVVDMVVNRDERADKLNDQIRITSVALIAAYITVMKVFNFQISTDFLALIILLPIILLLSSICFSIRQNIPSVQISLAAIKDKNKIETFLQTNEERIKSRYTKVERIFTLLTLSLILIFINSLIFLKPIDSKLIEAEKLKTIIESHINHHELQGLYFVKAQNVRLRSAPSYDSSVLLTLERGSTLLKHESIELWINVTLKNSNESTINGWVHSDYIGYINH